MLKNLLRIQLLVLLWLAGCNGQEQLEVAPQEDTTCPYKLPWSYSHAPVLVSQGADDPKNKSHLPNTPDQYAIDFNMPIGTEVLAARNGTISRVQNGSTEGGDDRKYASRANYVLIDHGDNTAGYYTHLSSAAFDESDIGTKVSQGDVIGLSGNTGWSSGPHLHFQVQNKTDGYGQSIPFCFADVPEGVPVAGEKYTSQNGNVTVQGAQVEGYTENLDSVATGLTGEISFFAINQEAEEANFVVHKLATGEEELTAVSEGDPFSPATYVTWLPDGNTLVGSWAYSVFSKNYETGKVEVLFEPKGEVTMVPDFWNPGFEWADALNDEGLLIDCLWVEYAQNPPINYSGICWYSFAMKQVYSFYGDAVDYPMDHPLTRSDVDYLYPSASLDGAATVFVRQYYQDGEKDGFPELVTIDTAHSVFTPLYTGNIHPVFPKMSDNGKQIIFLGYMGEREEDRGIWAIDANGKNLREILTFSSNSPGDTIDWSKDGRLLLFNKNSDLWILDFDSGKEIQITNTPGILEFQPIFRPNH